MKYDNNVVSSHIGIPRNSLLTSHLVASNFEQIKTLCNFILIFIKFILICDYDDLDSSLMKWHFVTKACICDDELGLIRLQGYI